MFGHDFHGVLLRSVIQPLGDRWRGVPIGRKLDLLEETQWWPRERLEDLQNQKLRKLIQSSYERIPYYRDMMDARRLKPTDIQTSNDLVKLPFFTKDVIRAQGRDRLLHRDMSVKKLRRIRTSGATGQPQQVYLSKMTWAYSQASFFRYFRWCGIERGDRYFMIWGRPITLGLWPRITREMNRRLVNRQVILGSWDMTPEKIGSFLRRMSRAGPSLLRG